MPGREVFPRFKAPRTAKRARRAATVRAYNAWAFQLLIERPRCEVCHAEASEMVHHRRRRSRGGALMNRDNALCVSAACHQRIHANPAWAREHGFLVFTGDPGWDDLGGTP